MDFGFVSTCPHGGGAMLDLETIFDPDRTGPTRAPTPASPSGIIPNDLPPEWHLAWDERAAIMEYDGGLTRDQAEARALADILEAIGRAGPRSPRPECDLGTGRYDQ